MKFKWLRNFFIKITSTGHLNTCKIWNSSKHFHLKRSVKVKFRWILHEFHAKCFHTNLHIFYMWFHAKWIHMKKKEGEILVKDVTYQFHTLQFPMLPLSFSLFFFLKNHKSVKYQLLTGGCNNSQWYLHKSTSL